MRWLATTAIALASVILAYSLLFVDAPASAQIGGAIDEPTATFTPTATPTTPPFDGGSDDDESSKEDNGEDGASGECAGGPGCVNLISISHLSSSLAVRDTDRFQVRASELSTGSAYKIRVRRESSNRHIGFNTNCSTNSYTASEFAGATSRTEWFTLRACSTPGDWLRAELLRYGGGRWSVVKSTRKNITVRSSTSNSCSVSALGTLYTTKTASGSWSSSCYSKNRSGRYARFYRFEISSRKSVTIDLKSSTDAYMYLLNGSGTNGSVLQKDDDGGDGTNSRITRTLSKGSYTIEATTFRSGGTGSFTLKLKYNEPTATPTDTPTNTPGQRIQIHPRQRARQHTQPRPPQPPQPPQRIPR